MARCDDCKWYYLDDSLVCCGDGFDRRDDDMCELFQTRAYPVCKYFEEKTEKLDWLTQGRLAEEKRKAENILTYHEQMERKYR